MGRIRSKDTKPEKAVRSLLHRLGFRFRLHRKDLPGKPDIVLPKYHTAILIQGCFWHGHDCKIASKPKSNTTYWGPKIESNRSRDLKTKQELTALGWKVLELWECEIRSDTDLPDRIVQFLRKQS